MKMYYMDQRWQGATIVFRTNSIIVVAESREEAYTMICNVNNIEKLFYNFEIDFLREVDIVPGLTFIIT